MSRCVQRTAGGLLLFILVMLVITPDAEARKKPWEKFKYPELGEIQIPDYERVELDNGMIVYLAEDHEFPLVELSATIRAGGIYEPAAKIGLASITGSVLRTGGTEKMSGDEIDELVEAKGMVLETWIGTSNGGAYLSAMKEDTELGMSLLADILMQPHFDPDKIELAKKQQSAGISRRNDEPLGIARREATKVIYGADHPLARHPEYDTINAITRDDLITFHQRFFHPNYTYLVVIGDFDRSAMLALIEQEFAAWSRTDQSLPPDPDIPDFPRTVNVVDKEDLTQSTMVLGHIGIRADDPNYAAIQVGNRILGGGFSSRLFNEVRTKRGYAYSVGSSPGTGFRYPGVFMAYCGTKSVTSQVAIEVIIAEIERMTVEPVTVKELSVAKDGILNSEVFNFDSKREILDRMVTFEMYGYPADFLTKYMVEVRDMTAEKILQAAQMVWHPEKLSILAVGNRADWDGDLTEFGPVNEIDITIPEPSLELDIPVATEESLQRGQELMAAVAIALGGKELASLTGYHEKLALEAEVQGMSLSITIDKTVQFPDKQHVVQKLPFGEMTMVLNGDSGWKTTPMGEENMSAEEIAEARKELETDTWIVFRDHEKFTCQALVPTEVEGRSCLPLYFADVGGDYMLLYLDAETKLPYMVQTPGEAPMTQAPVTQKTIMTDYQLRQGLQVATSFTIKHDDVVFATGHQELFELNPTLDESLFTR